MAKLMYRDAANYKTLLTLPLPKQLNGKVEIGLGSKKMYNNICKYQ